MGVKRALIFAVVLLGGCVGTLKRPTEAPTPVAAAPKVPASNIPPLILPSDSVAAPAGNEAEVADVPVTVLPTIIGHRVDPNAPAVRPEGGITRDNNDQVVRIALGTSQSAARLGATGDWDVYDIATDRLVAQLHAGDSFTTTQSRGKLVSKLVGKGASIPTVKGPLIVRTSDPETFISYGGHRYRGEIGIAAGAEGITVINRVAVEDYLRGVVPLEIGPDRTAGESAAIEAQAIAARSYAYSHMNDNQPYDMVATTSDQVYGGVDAEMPLSDAAVVATRNMVMMYAGKVITAPYHANSGGVTASASEVWRGGDEPYLVSVSDRIPGTDHYYGEDSPRFRWTRTLTASQLTKLADKYLPQYSNARKGRVGKLLKITATGYTASGRVAGLVFKTDRGSYTVTGDRIRFVLRSASGILPSTLFTFDQSTDKKGHITRLTIHGSGNGHGVGMDQWGAIARARAGQDVLTILRTYYPGTTIGRVI